MESTMKDIGNLEKLMDMEGYFIQMVMYIKDTSHSIKLTAMEYTLTTITQNTKAHGLMIFSKEKEKKHGLIKLHL